MPEPDQPAAGPRYLELFAQFDPPFGDSFDESSLGENFADELRTTSRLWFQTGYGQGIAAYLNFFLLKDFIDTHDKAKPSRFADFKSMARSFYQTDLFVRDVTDSGKRPTGGISNPTVRRQLAGIMARHERLHIPHWMMSYFGYQLAEAVETQCAPLSDSERGLHLSYMARTYRIMGIPFSADRQLMEDFARDIEARHAGPTPQLERHAGNILRLGEMIGVSSDRTSVLALLPEKTRAVFAPIHHRVRPGFMRRLFLRAVGRVVVKQAVGEPREAVPFCQSEDVAGRQR